MNLLRVLCTTLVVILVLTITVKCHDCKDYTLTASDQSMVDMVTHYLHTTRRSECKESGKSANLETGVTYIRWGKKTCPAETELVYSGQAGGNLYTNKGGGVNHLCLPNDPENGKPYSFVNDVLYGAEYEVSSGNNPSGMSATLHDKEVVCAVCRRKQKSSVLMIPGRRSCYSGWNYEYDGFLMSSYKTHHNSDYACVDKNAEALDGGQSSENGSLFYGVRAKCGSLRCPPYKDGTEVHCVVCSK